MNAAQSKALDLLRADSKRDLYETAAPENSKKGSGQFMVTYSNGESPVLTERDMQDLWAHSLIRPKYPDNLEIKVFVLALGKSGDGR